MKKIWTLYIVQTKYINEKSDYFGESVRCDSSIQSFPSEAEADLWMEKQECLMEEHLKLRLEHEQLVRKLSNLFKKISPNAETNTIQLRINMLNGLIADLNYNKLMLKPCEEYYLVKTYIT